MTRTSRTTRAWLAGELAQWRAEGLVDERAAQELTRRYGLAADATSRALAVVYIVASVLIGGGVLSFVAWNWEHLPAAAKLGLGGAALVSAYSGGYWLAEIGGRRPLLGRALVLLGSLLFGANIGIVGQVFQLDGEFWGAAGLWGAGAALAAWCLRAPVDGFLATVLGCVWSIGRMEGGGAAWAPLVPAAVLVPLAFQLRAPLLFGAVAVSTSCTLAAAAVEEEAALFFTSAFASAGLFAALAVALPARLERFAVVARRLATVVTVVLAYALSFHELSALGRARWVATAWLPAILPQLLGIATCLGFAGRAGLARMPRETAIVLGAAGLLAAALFLPEPEVPLAVVANLTLAAVAAEGVRSSVHDLVRGRFWTSVALLLTVIVTRFVEFETGLLVKALVFTLCGAAVLAFGLAFERRATARRAGHA